MRNPQSGHPRQRVIRNPQVSGFRLPAEQIRDNALAISGLLDRRIGGPSVYPVQPASVGQFRDATAGQWKTSSGADRYRRGMYTFWQRMSPYPSLATFDAPSRERCTVGRPITNTPLQSLVMLNDPVYVEMAVAFARRIIREAPEPNTKARTDYAFRLSLARPPTDVEESRVTEFFEKQLVRFQSNKQAAAKLVSDAKETEIAELAAWIMVAQVLLNLDETITKE